MRQVVARPSQQRATALIMHEPARSRLVGAVRMMITYQYHPGHAARLQIGSKGAWAALPPVTKRDHGLFRSSSQAGSIRFDHPCAAGWIASGMLTPRPARNPAGRKPAEEPKPSPRGFGHRARVPQQHQLRSTLSCNTKADHSSVAVARGGGVIVDLNVDRGSRSTPATWSPRCPTKGARRRSSRRRRCSTSGSAEYEANKKLIDRGKAPKNQLPALEAAVAAAEAALVDRQRRGRPSDDPLAARRRRRPRCRSQVGQAIQIGDDDRRNRRSRSDAGGRRGKRAGARPAESRTGSDRALHRRQGGQRAASAIVGVERRRRDADLSGRDDDGQRRMRSIADGVTCEMVVDTAPIEAASIPRSALVFSDDGELGVALRRRRKPGRVHADLHHR